MDFRQIRLEYLLTSFVCRAIMIMYGNKAYVMYDRVHFFLIDRRTIRETKKYTKSRRDDPGSQRSDKKTRGPEGLLAPGIWEQTSDLY